VDILKAASVFNKLAQVKSPERIAYENHVIRVNQQADVLNDGVEQAIAAGFTPPEANNYVDSFKNLAVRYTGEIRTDTSIEELQPLYEEMLNLFNRIKDNYVDERYEPMEMIRDSLAYIGNYNNTAIQEAGDAAESIS
jgi:hypothetical protein